MDVRHDVARHRREQVLALRKRGVDYVDIALTLGYANGEVVRRVAWRAREEQKRKLRRLKTINFAASNQGATQ